MKIIAENLTPEEAWLRLSVHPSLPSQSLSVQDAFDHVLAADLFANEDVPSGKRSFRDGYAVQSRDLSTVPTKIQLIRDIPMGIVPTDAIRSGQTMSIPTGGYLPEGADAVVMQEDTDRNGNEIVVKRSVAQVKMFRKSEKTSEKVNCSFLPDIVCVRRILRQSPCLELRMRPFLENPF